MPSFGGLVLFSTGSHTNVPALAPQFSVSLVMTGINDVLLCVYEHVCCDPRYTRFEGHTGVSTVPTSCGASSHRAFAVQVTVHSGFVLFPWVHATCHGQL